MTEPFFVSGYAPTMTYAWRHMSHPFNDASSILMSYCCCFYLFENTFFCQFGMALAFRACGATKSAASLSELLYHSTRLDLTSLHGKVDWMMYLYPFYPCRAV